uniref:Glycine-rich protein n=1 Tax=Globodera rostochiensis TaxID=31243 RepID=A0A914HAE0_GLORO
MPYVNERGELQDGPSFSIVRSFWSLFYFFAFFVRSLFGPLINGAPRYDPDSAARHRSLGGNGRGGGGWGGGGGGGGGGWRPGGGGGGGGPRRPMGRLNNDGPSSMPSCPSGGCCR